MTEEKEEKEKKECGCEACDGEPCICDGDEWDMEQPAVILCGVHREDYYGRLADRRKDLMEE